MQCEEVRDAGRHCNALKINFRLFQIVLNEVREAKGTISMSNISIITSGKILCAIKFPYKLPLFFDEMRGDK